MYCCFQDILYHEIRELILVARVNGILYIIVASMEAQKKEMLKKDSYDGRDSVSPVVTADQR